MKYKGIIFDLDGTLLNTLKDLGEAMNRALEGEKLPTHALEKYKIFVGSGLDRLIARTIPGEKDPELAARLKQAFNEQYARNWADTSAPYPGVPEMLEALKRKKLKTAVFSNKPQDFVLQCVGTLLSPWNFFPVLGASEETPLKPSPAGALRIAGEWDLEPGEILFVGDTKTDMETASRAGMVSVGVTWGFREVEELRAHKAAYIIHSPEELLPLLEN